MILKLKIFPYKIEDRSKVNLQNRLKFYGYTVNNYGSYYDDLYNKDTIRVVNFQKVNKKTKQTQKVVNGKNITTSKIIRDAHWVAYYYYIPKTWLAATNSRVEQRSRNFIIKKNK